MGFLDHALSIELCARELALVVEACNDFRPWRDVEARRRGEDATKVPLTHAEWAETRRLETIARLHPCHGRQSALILAWPAMRTLTTLCTPGVILPRIA